MKQIRNIILTILVILCTIILVILVNNNSIAANNKIDKFSTTGNTIWGISEARDADLVGWVDYRVPTNNPNFYKNWGTEGSAIRKPVGALCFGHATQGANNGDLKSIVVLDIYGSDIKINGESQSYDKSNLDNIIKGNLTARDAFRLAYYVYFRSKVNNSTYSQYIRRLAIDSNLVSVQEMNNGHGIDTSGINDDAMKYSNSIGGLGFRKLSDDNGRIKYNTINNIEYAFIGPYKIETHGGEITKANIIDKNGSKIETTKFSKGGTSILTTTYGLNGNINDFYIVVEKNKLTSVEKIILSKNYSEDEGLVYSKIVLCEPHMANGQNICVYGGYRENGSVEIELPGVQETFLKIKKVDDSSKEAISGATFKVKNNDGTYVVKNNLMNEYEISYTNNENDATVFTTNSNGIIEIEHLTKFGKYQFIEISNPEYGYLEIKEDGSLRTNNDPMTIEVESGTSNFVEIDNKKQTGNLVIKKKDSEFSDKILAGVEFTIKGGAENSNNGKYVKITNAKNNEGFDIGNNTCEGIVHILGMEFVESEENATRFITDSNGLIKIYNILKGSYDVEEVSVGDNRFYEIDENYISWDLVSYQPIGNNKYEKRQVKSLEKSKIATSIWVHLRDSRNTNQDADIDKVETNPFDELTFTNKRKYIDLSGYVWEDIQSTGKPDHRNDLYNTNMHPEVADFVDDKDAMVGNVTVRLKDRTTGEIVKETKTSEQTGKYKFNEVIIENLKNYYIEFEYDGLTYTNVKSYKEIVSEYSSSQSSTILKEYFENAQEYNTSKAVENSNDRQEFNDRFAEVKGETSDTGITIGTDQKEKYKINYETKNHEANLKNIEVSDQETEIRTTVVAKTYDTETNQEQYSLDRYEPGIEEIENINLGLCRREMPDIALIKDLSNVEIAINGKNHIYEYEQRFLHNKDDEYGDGFNIGVKFENRYGSVSYTRPIYKADVEYEITDESKKSNELKMYATYRIKIKNQSSTLKVKVNSILDYFDSNYKLLNVGTSISEYGDILDNIKYTIDDKYNSSKYSKSIIEMDYIDSAKGYGKEIDAGKEIDIYAKFELNRESILKLLNDGENLNNIAEINSYSVFKADKLYAGIDEDSNPGNTEPGNKETYEDDTDEAPGLKLEVADAREISGKVFLDSSTVTETNERIGSGKYEDDETGIKDVQVSLVDSNGTAAKIYDTIEKRWKEAVVNTQENGDFIISGFVPGDYKIIYTWGDNTYTVQNYKGTIWTKENIEEKQNNADKWYKNQTKDSAGITLRYSDAKDNYNIQQEEPKGSRIQIDEETKNTELDNYKRRKMDSTTNEMDIGVEYETTYTASTGDKYTYRINNVDFGIVERARQALEIDKRAYNLKIVSGMKQTIVDANIIYDEDKKQYRLENDVKNVTYMPPSYNKLQGNGLIKTEIDDELMQGSKIYIKYKITVKNKSEVDYNSENYYLYGKLKNTENANELMIKLKPTNVYDYYDDDMTYIDADNNGKWKLVNYSDYNNVQVNQSDTLIEKAFKEWNDKKVIDNDIIEENSYEYYQKEYYEIIKEWNESTIRQDKLKNKAILQNTGELEKELKPREEISQELQLEKNLYNSDEIDLNNDCEIIKIERSSNTGRQIIPRYSVIYDRGESVRVITPTGDNNYNMEKIIIVLSGLIIIGTGIIFIKKKILK